MSKPQPPPEHTPGVVSAIPWPLWSNQRLTDESAALRQRYRYQSEADLRSALDACNDRADLILIYDDCWHGRFNIPGFTRYDALALVDARTLAMGEPFIERKRNQYNRYS